MLRFAIVTLWMRKVRPEKGNDYVYRWAVNRSDLRASHGASVLSLAGDSSHLRPAPFAF